jgi:ribonuclease P protein component
VRNRIRRVIHEAVRKDNLLAGSKVDILIFVHNEEIGSWSYEKLVNELQKILLPAIQKG